MRILYAIIAAGQSNLEDLKNISEVSASELYFISYNQISAVLGEFNLTKDAMNTEFALKYARVIDALAQQVTVLPLRFGTFIRSDNEISQTLANHYELFLVNLKKVFHANEFGLKVLWNKHRINNQIKMKAVTSHDVRFEGALHGNNVYVNYLLKKMKSFELEDTVLKQVERLTEDIGCYLKPWCRAQKFKKMVTKNILLDAAFLIPVNKTDDFIMAAQAWTRQHNDFHFLLSGPWPPYSFSDAVTT